MNGAHDLGGRHGLGPISPEAENEEPVFHHHWETRVFAMTLACGFLGQWNIDMSRHARERQHPVDYLSNSYYENWLAGLETLLKEHDMLSDSDNQPVAVTSERINGILSTGGPVDIPITREARFQRGDRVLVINNHPIGHTRVPRYTRGHTGTVVKHHGGHVFPDRNARGDKVGEHLYTVSFSATELWGKTGDNNSHVQVDLWEPYLSPVEIPS